MGDFIFYFSGCQEGCHETTKNIISNPVISLLVFLYTFDEPQHDKTNKTSTTLINADQTKTGQKTWLVQIVSLMVLSCSGPNTLALLNKQLSNSSFSLFFSCHAAPFFDKCFLPDKHM